jgi:hypothetical protein
MNKDGRMFSPIYFLDGLLCACHDVVSCLNVGWKLAFQHFLITPKGRVSLLPTHELEIQVGRGTGLND